jgi:hypothetical protein
MTPKLNVKNLSKVIQWGIALPMLCHIQMLHTHLMLHHEISQFLNFGVSIFSYCNDLKRLSLGVIKACRRGIISLIHVIVAT